MLVVYGITDMHNTAGNHATQLFIDSQGFMGIGKFTMQRIKELPHIINDHTLVPNQEARLGSINQLKLQAIVWRKKD